MRDEARTIDETAGVLKGPSARIYTVHVGSIARPDDRTVARCDRSGAPCRRPGLHSAVRGRLPRSTSMATIGTYSRATSSGQCDPDEPSAPGFKEAR